MYPPQTKSRAQTAKSQRKDLHRLMSARLQSKYEDKDENVIEKQVKKLIKNEDILTSEKLLVLENTIKALPSKNRSNQPMSAKIQNKENISVSNRIVSARGLKTKEGGERKKEEKEGGSKKGGSKKDGDGGKKKEEGRKENSRKEEEGGRKRNDDEHSAVSKMSGASNFDWIDNYKMKGRRDEEGGGRENEKRREEEKKEKGGERSEDQGKREVLVLSSKSNIQNELGNLSENNQWGAILKYNEYLYKKEDKIKELREAEKKKELKTALDNQLKEKEGLKVKKKEEKQGYQKYEEDLMMRDEKEEKKKEDERKKRAKNEKSMRDKQIRDNKRRRREEEDKGKKIDALFLGQLSREGEAEEERRRWRREEEEKRRVREGEKRKREEEEKKREAEEERRQEIRLQEEYCRLQEENEKKKEAFKSERLKQIKDFMDRGAQNSSQDFLSKIEAKEDRSRKYALRLEKEQDQKELNSLLQQARQKTEMKDFLFKQMEEKKLNKDMEGRKFNVEQVAMWNDDTRKYREWEHKKKEEKNIAIKENTETLFSQMQRKQEEKRKLGGGKMDLLEEEMNKKVLDDIRRLEKE